MIRRILFGAMAWLAISAAGFAASPPSGNNLPVQATRTTGFTVQSKDLKTMIPVNCASPCTVILPAITSSWPKGYPVQIMNAGTQAVTVSPTGPSVIYGIPTTAGNVILVTSGHYVVVNADAANNYLGYGVTSTSAVVPGGTDGQAQRNSSGAFAGTSGLTLSATKMLSMSVGLGSDATGDIYYNSGGGTLSRLGIGLGGQVLAVASGLPAWIPPPATGVTNVATTAPLTGGPITATGTVALTGPSNLTTFTANAVPKGAGTSPFAASSLTDNGTTVITTEQVSVGGLTATDMAGVGARCVHVDATGKTSPAAGDCATGGGGSVTSVSLAAPAEFTVSGSPITTTGTLTLTKATQTANTLWAGPTTGAAVAPAFRALVAGDLPAGTTPVGANPTGTVGTAAVNGVATTFMRSDAAPPLAAGAAAANVGTLGGSLAGTLPNPTLAAGVVPVGANPTGTVGATPVNGVLTTFMRSDAAPPLAAGAAAANVGTLGGSLAGTLPNPTLASGAVSVGLSVPATSIFGVTGSPVSPTGTLGLTTTGTSGGIPYFSSTSQLATSAALGANLPLIGGGPGVAPSTGTRSGNTTQFVTTTGAQTAGNCVQIDPGGSGNYIAAGAGCAGSAVITSAVGQVPIYSSTTQVTGSPNFTLVSGLLKFDTNTSSLNIPTFAGSAPLVTFAGPEGATARLALVSFGTNSAIQLVGVGGTAAAPTAVPTSTTIGQYNFAAYDGTNISNTATIVATSTQLHTTANKGTSMTLRTTRDNSAAPIDAVLIDQAQNITVAGQAGSGTRCVHADLNGKQSTTTSDCPTLSDAVVAKTASYPIVAADNGTTFTNSGAAGVVTFTLPTGTNIGFNVCFVVATGGAGIDLVIAAPAASGVRIAIGELNGSANGTLTIGKGSGTTTPFATQCLTELTATQWISKSGSGSWSLS